MCQVKTHDTLCWLCQNAGGNCSWSKSFTPVDGWKAVPTKVQAGFYSKTNDPRFTDSYDVYECPEFELLSEIKNRFSNKKPKKARTDRHSEERNEYAQIQRLLSRGKSIDRIARDLGYSESTIYRKIKRYEEKNNGV